MSATRIMRGEFDAAWALVAQAYAFSVAPKTLKHMKEAGWNLYLQGRTDEMARQLSASQKTAGFVSRRHDTTAH